MLRRQALLMCGKGVFNASSWEPSQAGRDEEVPGGAYHHRVQQLKPRQQQQQPRSVCSSSRRPGWHHRRRGRTPSFSRAPSRQHYQQQAKVWPRCSRPMLLSLRPINLMGKRAPGMRAPRNTNQFLMREKYQLMHLRSDSVGTDSGGSDCEMDPLDMDSYLGVLENARGALLDCPAAQESPPAGALPSPPPELRCLGGCLEGVLQEESLQYFPSEEDVIESELFMERDFQEFCSRIA